MSNSDRPSSGNLDYYPSYIYPRHFVSSVNRQPIRVPGQSRPIHVEQPVQLSDAERRTLFTKTGRFFPRYVLPSTLPELSESEPSSDIRSKFDIHLFAEEEQPEIMAYRNRKAAKRTLKAQRKRQYKVLRNVEELKRIEEEQQMRRAARRTYRAEARRAAPINRRTLRRQWMEAAGPPKVNFNRRAKRANWWHEAGIAAGLHTARPSSRRAKVTAPGRQMSAAEKRMLARVTS